MFDGGVRVGADERVVFRVGVFKPVIAVDVKWWMRDALFFVLCFSMDVKFTKRRYAGATCFRLDLSERRRHHS